MWAKRDPIARFERYLRARGLWDGALEERLVADLNDEITEAIRAAEAAGPPPTDTLISEVFAEPTPQLRAEWAELQETLAR
jgi:2-oxoisovalerate dehydrogenase E1 component alpha subunit